MTSTTVPREKVEALAAHIHQLHGLRMTQLATVAKMIRACHAQIVAKPSAFATAADRQKIANDRAKALSYLEALATQLENESVRSSDDQPKETPDVLGS